MDEPQFAWLHLLMKGVWNMFPLFLSSGSIYEYWNILCMFDRIHCYNHLSLEFSMVFHQFIFLTVKGHLRLSIFL